MKCIETTFPSFPSAQWLWSSRVKILDTFMQAGINGIKIHATFLTYHQILTTQKSIQFKNRSDIDQIFQKLPKASKMKYTLIETEMSKYIKMKQVVLASFSSFLKNNFQFACAETFLCLSKRQINTNFLLNVILCT